MKKIFYFTLEKKLNFSFAILLGVFAAIFVLIFLTLIKQNSDAITINLLGKQRMLFQKISKEILSIKYLNIPDDQLLKTISNIDESLKVLRDGGILSNSIKISRVTDKKVFTQLTILIRLWDEYKSILEYYLQTKDEGLFESALNKNERLIEEANVATNLMEEASLSRVYFIRYTLLIGLLIYLFIFLISRRIIHKFIGNLNIFISSFELGSSGDLTQIINIKVKDETQKLALFYNDFISKLVSILNQIKATVLHNQETFESLSDKTKFTTNAVNQIFNNSNNALNNSKELTNNYGNMSDEISKIEELIAKINEEIKLHNKTTLDASNITNSVVESLIKLKEKTLNSQDEVKNLKSMIGDGEKALDDFKNWIISISNSVDSVAQMIVLVHKTIEKTSILAMNASIEAAHAREFGSGFSIVADEVSKLSEEEEENINLINSNLLKIQNDIMTTNESVENTISVIKSILKTTILFSESQIFINKKIEEIADNGNQVQQIFMKLLDFAKNLANLSDVISNHIININKYLVNVKEKIQANEISSQNINSEIEKIKESLDQFNLLEKTNKNYIEKLNEMIGSFKLPDNNLPENPLNNLSSALSNDLLDNKSL